MSQEPLQAALTGPSCKVRASMLHELTGCTRPVFARLLKAGRHRQSGAGRPCQHAEWVALLVTLMKLRHNLPYQMIETLTGIDAVTASCMVRRTLTRLAGVRLLTKGGKVSFYIVDATVTRVGTRDRACYSGHKHYKGLRTQILCDDRKRIHHISPAYPASAHDKTIWNRHVHELKLIPHCRILADKAYAGAKMENIRLFRPVRRHERACRENKAKAKADNRALSRLRVRVEHVLASLKRFRILRDRFPLALDWYTPCMHLVALLHNLEIRFKEAAELD